MFGIFRKRSAGNSDLKNVDDIMLLIKSQGAQKAGELIKQAANTGNLTCQIFLSQAGLFIPAEKRPAHVKRDTELYTKLAAEGGDLDSHYNLAKLYIDQLDVDCEYWSDEDLERIRLAKHWHRKAAARGYQPSITSLKNLECFPD